MEAQFAYLQGLNPRIRELVRTKEDITDIRALQNACIRLDTQDERQRHDIPNALEVSSSTRPRGSRPRGSTNNYRGRGNQNNRGGRGYKPYQSAYRSQNQSQPDLSQHNDKSAKVHDNEISRAQRGVKCHLCDKMGHLTRDCPKLKDAKAAVKNQANACGTIIDSGASTHMFGNMKDFENLQTTLEVVYCANGTKTKATHWGL